MNKSQINIIAILIVGTIAAIFSIASSNPEIKLAYAQQNTTTNESFQNFSDLLSNRGINNILYTKYGGIAGLNEIYTYDIVTKEITYVNTMNEVKRKTLDQAQIDALNDIIYDPGIVEVYDRKICPDCIQYGLSYSFVDYETLLKLSSFSYWTDITKKPNTEGLTKLGSMIEELAKK